ncbi:NAD(P)-dependent oxidoreductase [Salarchaeum japonicum]|uniref:NAD(P)-dependent oxidoreductase n=1 Tax=Salarchaeum japonicum TaxID=555573 RepID=UPI003C773D59
MQSVLVTTSESRPVRADVLTAALPDDWTVETYEIDADGLERGSGAELAAAADGHDALVLRPGVADRALFAGASSLEVLAVYGSGYGRVDLDAATEHGVVVTHSPGAPGPAVVEYTMASMTMLLRNILGIHQRTLSGEWQAAKSMGRELGRTTVGVVGLGTIGFDVAQRASGEGATVLGYDPYVAGDRTDSRIYPRHSREEVEAAGVELVGIEALVERAELVSLHAPLTDDTRNLIGADELAALDDGYLINVARGGVVDEDALVDAVENDRLAGVVVDVLSAEPPAADHPLLANPNVIATPHVAGVTDGYLERGARLAAEKVETVLGGGRPDTVVNPGVYDG